MSLEDSADESSGKSTSLPGYKTTVRYEGHGYVELGNPHIYVRGPIWVEFDEVGIGQGEMTVSEADADEHLHMGIFQILFRNRPEQMHDGSRMVLSFGLDSELNECTALTIDTDNGVFISQTPIGCSYSFGMTQGESVRLKLAFQFFNGIYIERQQGPKYWAMPITNFLTRFRSVRQNKLDHPLRIYKPERPSDDLSDVEDKIATFNLENSNRLIEFEYKGRPAYIEPLLDLDRRETELLEGRARRLATALMVGELPPDVQSDQQIERYLPSDLLVLLSLATGSEVGSPWIDVYGGDGSLVARFHSIRGQAHYSSGHHAIDEVIHGGTGLLLTSGSKSPIFDSAILRVTAKHIVRGGTRDLTVEDRLSHLIRALDGLCKLLQISGEISVSEVLSEEEVETLRPIVKQAAKQVRSLRKHAERNGNIDAAKVLADIADRISNSTKVQRGFGANVSALIQRYGLNDLEVVEQFYEQNPRTDGRSWLAMLSYYRGLVMHNGFIDFDRNPYAQNDASILLDHLHDLLLRLMLKLLEYGGTYQPSVMNMTVTFDLDWVDEQTIPKHLGYE